MSAHAHRRYTLLDYEAVELGSPLRHEFVGGAIYAMAGGSPRHNEVAANLVFALRTALADTPCRPIGSDQRVRVSDTEYTYPDVTVFCGPIETAPGPPAGTATNPALVIEVLSDATRAYDCGEKLAMYQRIPSVREVWLVEPDAVHLTIHRREGETWAAETLDDPAASVRVLGSEVSLAAVMERVVG